MNPAKFLRSHILLTDHLRKKETQVLSWKLAGSRTWKIPIDQDGRFAIVSICREQSEVPKIEGQQLQTYL